MQSGSDVDLFSGFNEDEVSEVLCRCAGCGRFVLIGPPRSGKTFFKEKYLKDRLGAGVTVDEYTLGISTTAKIEGDEAKEGSGISEKVMKYLEGMIPLIKRLRDKASVEDEELRRVLGDKAPRLVVEGARRSIGDSPHRAYYIPWKCVEEPNACTSNKDVSRALELIKKVFDDKKIRIRWFKAEYVPPGLVEEVIDLIRVKGEDGAREELKGWVEAYSEANETLRKILGLSDDLLEWEDSFVEYLSNFVNNYASYVISGLVVDPLIGASALALISVLTYMAFKREGEGYLKGIIELKRSLERLRRSDGEFNELGKLLVYRVAYAMGMSYDEAKKALINITGLSIDELKRRVNEIERRIKELEKKIELSRLEVPAGIVTANVNEFAKGRTYPNVKVENGELRIRVEGGYHSIVRAGKFNELVNEVRDRLLKQGFVVVVGPKGIGKSTLAAAVIWELFMNSDIGLVARVDVLDSKNYSEFATFVENYGEKSSERSDKLLILYDPVSTKAYEKVGIDTEAPIQSNIERTIKNLVDIVNLISSKASKPFTLIVLPSDVYNALSGEVKNALEGYRLDVSQGLINTEFLAELIREYSKTKDKPNGCALSDDVLSKLAGELAKFDSGHALIARLIGKELARNNCVVDKVEELINSAKGKAEAFIILHINGLFKVHENPDTAKALVEIFALRRPFVMMQGPATQ
jgi:GTPase SAR1 family protein